MSDPSAPPSSDLNAAPYVYQPYNNDMSNFGMNPEYSGDLTNLNPTQTAYTSPAVTTPNNYDYLLGGGPPAVNSPATTSPTTNYVAMTPSIDKGADYTPPPQQPYVSPTTPTPVHQHVTAPVTSAYTPPPKEPLFQAPEVNCPEWMPTALLITFAIVAIIGLVGCVVYFPIWLGVFFGLANPQIIVKNTYQLTTCNATAQNIGQGNCCTKSCSTCANCGISQSSCSALSPSTQGANTTTGCCNGYYCCRTCCSTCVSCSSSGRSRSCYTYSCNCYCCQSVANQICQYQCKTCWKPVITVAVNLVGGNSANQTVTTSMSTDCGSAYGCVNNYFAQYPIGKEFVCIYNPNNPTQFQVGDGAYNKVYFDTMYAFASLTIISIALTLIGAVVAIGAWIWICRRAD